MLHNVWHLGGMAPRPPKSALGRHDSTEAACTAQTAISQLGYESAIDRQRLIPVNLSVAFDCVDHDVQRYAH